MDLSKYTAVWVFLAVIFYRETELMLAYLAAFFHEGAHFLTVLHYGIFPAGLKVDVFGLRLGIPFDTAARKKIMIYLSGPLASFLLFGLFYALGNILIFEIPMCLFFAYVNLYIGLINLIPVFPLDGAMALRIFLAGYHGIIRGATISRGIGVFFCGFLAGVCLLVILENGFNPSLAVIAFFLIFAANKEKVYSIMEKKLVLSGELYSGKKIKYIVCDDKTDLLYLARFISTEYTILAAAFREERFFCVLGQRDVISGIRRYGALCTVEEYAVRENI